MTDVPLACSCGTVRGVAHEMSGKSAVRMVCYCTDCQTYAHHLGQSERLDPNGGSEVLQVRPDRVEITEGWEHVEAVSQSPKGAVRWYASCCNTPIANVAGDPKFPFMGLSALFVEDSTSRDAAFGPVFARVQGKEARGDTSALDAHDGNPVSALVQVIPRILWWRVTGVWKGSPFLDERGRFRKERTLMPKERRAELQQQVRAL